MDTKIQLGSFVFRALEIPQQINFGGAQQLVQHDLIGGNRVIDALGQSDSDISWKGLIQGQDAITRAQELNRLRAIGQQLTLKWFNLNYSVVILSFIANTEKYFQITYEITLRVISDGNNPIASQNLVGFNDAIKGDLDEVNTIADGIIADPSPNLNTSTIVGPIAALNTAVNNVQTFNNASPETISTIQTLVSAAISAVGSAILPIASVLFGLL